METVLRQVNGSTDSTIKRDEHSNTHESQAHYGTLKSNKASYCSTPVYELLGKAKL